MKTIGVREFLRGGYQQIQTPTLVMSHSRPVGVWMPYDEEQRPVTLTLNSVQSATRGRKTSGLSDDL